MTEVVNQTNQEIIQTNELRTVVNGDSHEVNIPGLPEQARDIGEAAVSQLLSSHIKHEQTDDYDYSKHF